MSKDKPNPIHEHLMERRTVFLEGKINHNSISDVCSRMMLLQTQSAERITLLLNSTGGDLYPSLQLCDQMKVIMTAPVRGIVFGDCGSSATFIILHCKERYATPYSRFLVHSGRQGGIDFPIGRASREIAKQLLSDIKASEEQVIKLYIDHLTPEKWKGKKVNQQQRRHYVQRLIDRGDQRFNGLMSAEEAIKVGLIEGLCEAPPGIF